MDKEKIFKSLKEKLVKFRKGLISTSMKAYKWADKDSAYLESYDIEQRMKKEATQKAMAANMQGFQQARATIPTALESIATEFQQLQARGFQVEMRDPENIELRNYGSFVELVKPVLNGTTPDYQGLLIDLKTKKTYSY